MQELKFAMGPRLYRKLHRLIHSGASPMLEVGRVYRIPKDLFGVQVM